MRKARQVMAIVAAALVLAYVATVTVSEIGDTALWPGGWVWLGALAVVCGALLGFVNDSAAWSVIAAAALAMLIFVGLWGYVFWRYLGDYFSFFELVVSTRFINQVFPQSLIVLVTTVPLGLLGAVLTRAVIPERYRS